MAYDRYERQRRQTYGASTRRTTLGYWLPLAVTVTVATIGLAAWIWSERKDDDLDDYDKKREGRDPPQGSGTKRTPTTRGDDGIQMEEEGVVARMTGALRRSPSPQQIFDGASRRVAASVAAAGAVVGGALSSIREEDKRGFEDHTRWSEEAGGRIEGGDAKRAAPPTQEGPKLESRAVEALSSTHQSTLSGTRTTRKRKSVAIVVSTASDDQHQNEEITHHEENASILSHLPHYLSPDSNVFVLIYAPDLKHHPLDKTTQPSRPPMSLASSYSNIGNEDVQSHGDESEKPLSMTDQISLSAPSRSKMFNKLYTQAQALVDDETMVMPFTTLSGHVHLLRHLGPEIVYIQEILTGPGGDVVSQISNWVGQIVLVVGDESGHGGLVDSEDERGHLGQDSLKKWWQDDPRVGLGKGTEVVEGLRMSEDWRRRVGGHD